jgi:hypothetical protein
MDRYENDPNATQEPAVSAGRGFFQKAISSPDVEPLNRQSDFPLEPAEPTEERMFYLRQLARYLCSRKGIKTLALADSAGIAGSQKQKENKTQAFLNRYNRGGIAPADYRAFWNGVLKIHHEYERRGIELFSDPAAREAFALVYPQSRPDYADDDSFIDAPLQSWFSIEQQRSRDVCRHYSGLWWIVRPHTTRPKAETEAEFNLALLNIQPDFVSHTPLPCFKFHQPATSMSGGGEVTSQGRMLALRSDQILLLGKRRGSQTPTQLSWKYIWDPDRRKRETLIQGAIFTANTHGVLIQSYFHGCFIEGSDRLRGAEFEEADSFLKGFLGIRTESGLAEVPTSIAEAHELRQLQNNPDGLPAGLSALAGKKAPTHRALASPAGLERLKAPPQQGPILTIV